MEQDIYGRFDNAEAACKQAEAQLANSRTFIGRRIAGMRLAHHRRVVTSIMEEADTSEFVAIRTHQEMTGGTPVARPEL